MERVREGVTTFEGDMRNIDANLDYQERVRAVEALERDVEGCQRSLAESENVQVLQERVERIRKQALQAATRAAEVKGASSSYEEQVKRLEDMLTSDRYSNIESRNRKKVRQRRFCCLRLRKVSRADDRGRDDASVCARPRRILHGTRPRLAAGSNVPAHFCVPHSRLCCTVSQPQDEGDQQCVARVMADDIPRSRHRLHRDCGRPHLHR